MRHLPRTLFLSFFLLLPSTTAFGAPATKWAELKTGPVTPIPRMTHSLIYDPLRNRMILYGGYGYTTSEGYLSDVWALNFGKDPAWTQLATNDGPGARGFHSAIYDPTQDRVLVFGGVSNTPGQRDTYFNDVWSLSLSDLQWTRIIPTGTPPPPRAEHSAIYDASRNQMVIFGGYRMDFSNHVFMNDVWVLQLGDSPTWQVVVPQGAGPRGRFDHRACYVPESDQMVIIGGQGDFLLPPVNDVWALSLGPNPAWINLFPNSASADVPPETSGHAAIYDAPQKRLVMFGGCCPQNNNVWGFSLETLSWQNLTPNSQGPTSRIYTNGIYDPTVDRMVIFGGIDTFANVVLPDVPFLNDTWVIRLGDPRPVSRGHALPPTETNLERLARPRPLQVSPNPVVSEAQIRYSLAAPGWTSLSVYDLLGRKVMSLVERQDEAGEHVITWHRADMKEESSGIYFVKLVTREGSQVERVLVTR
jgi:hypothetical protein